MTQHPLGATLTRDGVDFSVYSRHASAIELCLFADQGSHELCRMPMTRSDADVWRLSVASISAGARYGYRAYGDYVPTHGLWFDPSKLLTDPYAVRLDRPFAYLPALGTFGTDTADLVPKSVVTELADIARQAPLFEPEGWSTRSMSGP